MVWEVRLFRVVRLVRAVWVVKVVRLCWVVRVVRLFRVVKGCLNGKAGLGGLGG